MQPHVDWPESVRKSVEALKSSPDRFADYDRQFDMFVVADPCQSWEEFCQWSSRLRGWGFRGQRQSEWPLWTALDRGVRVTYSDQNHAGHYPIDREEVTRQFLLRFQRRAHMYLADVPLGRDIASWLGLMQHYGAPTRLLDWTESPEIALYFAVRETETGTRSQLGDEATAAVWAIDINFLESRARDVLPEGQEIIPVEPRYRINYLNRMLSRRELPLVVRIDPLKANPRILAQKGFFLWKLFENTPCFDQILMSMIIHPEIPQQPVVRKLEIPGRLRARFRERLVSANIQSSTLFPPEHDNDSVGLEGLCNSLNLDLQRRVNLERQNALRLLRSEPSRKRLQ